VRLEDALEIALRNRIELMTARDQVDDAERRLRIRTQELLPQLRLVAERTRASRTGDRHLDSLAFGEDDYSAALELELPLDRVRERSALRAARVELSRNRRAQAELEDQVILSVRESLRDYRSSANSLAIQRQIVTSEEKNSKVARLRFENGEIGNRDLTDAQNNLVDAQDRLVRERVNVELARVQFLRDLGVLTLEEDGTWVR
jgi:outer membrane protein TolC